MKASRNLLSIILIILLVTSFTVMALAQDTEIVNIKVCCRAKTPMEEWRVNNFLVAAQELNADLEARGDPRSVEVEVVQVNLDWSEYVNKFVHDYDAGEAPDIWLTGHEYIGAQSEAGRIIALDELMKEFPGFKNIIDSLWDRIEYKGKIWGVPQDAEERLLLYWSKSLLKQIGWSNEEIEALPEKIEKGEFTLYDMLETAKQAVDNDVVEPGSGFWTRPNNGPDFTAFYYAFGGETIDPATGKLVFDKTAGLKYYKFFSDAVQKCEFMHLETSFRFGMDWGKAWYTEVSESKVLFWVGGTSQWVELAEIYLKDLGGEMYAWENFGFGLIPAAEKGGKPNSLTHPLAHPLVYVINSQCKHQDLALALLRILQSQTEYKFYKGSRLLSEALFYMLDYTTFLPNNPYWENYSAITYEALAEVVSGTFTPEMAIDFVAGELQHKLGDEAIIADKWLLATEPGKVEEGEAVLDPKVTRLEKLDSMLSLVLVWASDPDPEIRRGLANLAEVIELIFDGDPASDPLRVGAFLIVNADFANPDDLQSILGDDLTELFGPIALDDGTLLYTGAITVYPGRSQGDQPLSRVANLKGVFELEVSYLVEEELDVSTGNEATSAGLWKGIDVQTLHTWGLNGQGAIVGVIDSGIDCRHEDFWSLGPYNKANSRILYLWDQCLQPNKATDVNGDGDKTDHGEVQPAAKFRNEKTPRKKVGLSYPCGVEYTQAQINNWMNGRLAKDGSDVEVRSFDLSGHGTAVAGVAAGDGSHSGGRFTGVAPGASLIVVKLATHSITSITTSSFTSMIKKSQRHIILALHYILDRASTTGTKLPVVVNCSLGFYSGPHDGTSGFDRSIKALLGSGKIMVVSAGNEGRGVYHTENDGKSNAISDGASMTRRFNVPEDQPLVFLDVWFTAANNYTVLVRSPDGKECEAKPKPTNPLQEFKKIVIGRKHLIEIVNYKLGMTPPGDRRVTILITALDGGMVELGNWEMVIMRPNKTPGADGRFDAYCIEKTTFTIPSKEETIADPGNIKKVITVGAFVHRDAADEGKIVDFSSRGPTREIPGVRTGRRKPDITAPGKNVVMPRSGYANATYFPAATPIAGYTTNSGTSFAAPHVTGFVAIMLAANPNLTPEKVQEWLRNCFSRTDGTHAKGNTWGAGKLWCGCDQDGDGVPLLVEDSNLNGKLDRDETSDTKKDSDGDGVSDLLEYSVYYLSDIKESRVEVGWGSFHKDFFSKRGEKFDFILDGKTYKKGLDTHAPAKIIYNLNGQFTRFQSFVGLWDSGNEDRGVLRDFAGKRGSVRFIVVLYKKEKSTYAYDSGVMYWDTRAKFIDIDVSGVQTLELIVKDVEDLAYDWSIWADAKLLK
jgi:inositol-phosphate transport system substrate-binding protein